MLRLGPEECETLLAALEARPSQSSESLQAAALLRQRMKLNAAGGTSFDRDAGPGGPADDLDVVPCTLHVCTSCRPKGFPREPQENRPGYKLYEELRAAVQKSELRNRVDLRPAQCLSLCPRPCGIALSAPGAWSYLFGEQRPGESVADILECLATYLDSGDGLMPRDRRPNSLRATILGRVPPFDHNP
ncbi:MAG: DUF1636 domain-containing protein [Pseudomonadota bacterium]